MERVIGSFFEPPDPLLWEIEMYYEKQCEYFHMLGSVMDGDHEMFRHRLKDLEVKMKLGHHGDMADINEALDWYAKVKLGDKIKNAFKMFFDNAVYDCKEEQDVQGKKIREALRTIIE